LTYRFYILLIFDFIFSYKNKKTIFYKFKWIFFIVLKEYLDNRYVILSKILLKNKYMNDFVWILRMYFVHVGSGPERENKQCANILLSIIIIIILRTQEHRFKIFLLILLQKSYDHLHCSKNQVLKISIK